MNTKKCPHCGKTIEPDDDGRGSLLAALLFVGGCIAYGIAFAMGWL